MLLLFFRLVFYFRLDPLFQYHQVSLREAGARMQYAILPGRHGFFAQRPVYPLKLSSSCRGIVRSPFREIQFLASMLYIVSD